MKAIFMAVFYGSGHGALCVEANATDTVNQEAFDIIHNTGEIDEDRAELYWKAVSKSFGTKTLNFMAKIRNDFGTYEVEGEDGEPKREPKLQSPIKNMMPDGQEIFKKNHVRLDITGQQCRKKKGLTFGLTTGEVTMHYKKATFKTKEMDLAEYGRTGFVNLVHSIDALLARLIIGRLNDADIVNVLNIHDCFRVDVNHMKQLKQAIRGAYCDLFGTGSDIPTRKLWKGTDIMGMYLEAGELHSSLAVRIQSMLT